MRKAGTQFPAGQSAYIVFGALKGHKSPGAGVFSSLDSPRAAQLAARAGLMTLKVSGTLSTKLRDRVVEGAIGPKGQLRLNPVRPEILADLQAKYATQEKSPRKTTAGESSKTSPKSASDVALEPGAPTPPGNLPDIGQLIAAYRLVDAVGVWLEKLKVGLDDMLSQVGKSSAFSFLQEAETTEFDCYSGGDGWILDGWRWTYPTRHRRQTIGELSVVVDIGRPGRPAGALNVPCLLVMWSSAAHRWADAIDEAQGFWPPQEATTALIGDYCFHWIGKTPGNGPAASMSLRDGAWFYIVSLAALTSFSQLRKLVVQPALALLDGTPIEKAFASAPGVMRFHQAGKDFVLDE